MALPRFQKLPAERRHRLIAAAAREFAEKGYDGAALTAIAERSGIGKASVYYYFADKADLCATVLTEAWQRLRAEGRVNLATLSAKTFWPSVGDVATDNLELCRREPWLLAASKLLNRALSSPTGVGVLDEFGEKRRAWEMAFVRRGQELGTIRKDVPAELLASISLSARQSASLWILDHLEELGLDEQRRLVPHFYEIYRALLSPRPGVVEPRKDEVSGGVERRARVRKTRTA